MSACQRRITSILLILSLFCPIRALTISPDDEHAHEAALQWLQVVDSGNYKNAALMISDEVRGSQDWLNYFAAHRARLGRAHKRQLLEVKHASSMPGAADIRNHDIIRFNTSFERKPAALEEVVLVKMGCCWEVCGYSITEVTSDPPSRKATPKAFASGAERQARND